MERKCSLVCVYGAHVNFSTNIINKFNGITGIRIFFAEVLPQTGEKKETIRAPRTHERR